MNDAQRTTSEDPNPLCQDCGEYQHQCACHERMRPLETDFYYDSMNGVWVYKWSDSRLILTTESVLEYRAERRSA